MSNDLFGNEIEAKPEKSSRAKPTVLRGCSSCPLHGETQVFGKVLGKKILVLGIAPGKTEVQKQSPLVGPSGAFLWKRAQELGAFTRSDCDVDNVVRCRPVQEKHDGQIADREPSKTELHCCSLHTERQLAKANPAVILLLGKVAPQQILGSEYRKDQSVYWDTTRECKVICAPHPSFLLRGAPRGAFDEFDAALRAVKSALEYPGRWDYLKAQDYKTITEPRELEEYLTGIRESKRIVVVDIEDGRDLDGNKRLSYLGLSAREGQSRGVCFYHTAHKINEVKLAKMKVLLKEFLEDLTIRKGFWHGISDVYKLRDMEGIWVQGYFADGEHTEYLTYPERKDYMLKRCADVRFKEFGGWKEIIEPYLGPQPNYASIPLDIMTLYNGADCDITHRALVSCLRELNPKLVQTLASASFVLAGMEKRGIGFDFQHARDLDRVYRPLENKLQNAIALVAGDPSFTPTPDRLAWLLTTKLGLKIEGKKTATGRVSMGKKTLQKAMGQHKVLRTIIELGWVKKLRSTYITGFERAARFHDGRVCTRWKIHGTETGRLSSGGGSSENKEEKDRVNLQNIHGDPNAQCMLISTVRWREIVEASKHQKVEQDD